MQFSQIYVVVATLASVAIASPHSIGRVPPQTVPGQDTGLNANANVNPSFNPNRNSNALPSQPDASINTPVGSPQRPSPFQGPLISDDSTILPSPSSSCSVSDYSTAIQNLQKVIQQQIATISDTIKKVVAHPVDSDESVLSIRRGALTHLDRLNNRLSSDCSQFTPVSACLSQKVSDDDSVLEHDRAHRSLARQIAQQKIALLECMDSSIEKDKDQRNKRMLEKLSQLRDMTMSVQAAFQVLVCRAKKLASVPKSDFVAVDDCGSEKLSRLERRWFAPGPGFAPFAPFSPFTPMSVGSVPFNPNNFFPGVGVGSGMVGFPGYGAGAGSICGIASAVALPAEIQGNTAQKRSVGGPFAGECSYDINAYGTAATQFQTAIQQQQAAIQAQVQATAANIATGLANTDPGSAAAVAIATATANAANTAAANANAAAAANANTAAANANAVAAANANTAAAANANAVAAANANTAAAANINIVGSPSAYWTQWQTWNQQLSDYGNVLWNPSCVSAYWGG
ncbi:hypothetical protein BASA60_000460 [Batrachochytrium salamandrivorans]|nr:hypothetical protein BASA60_000460 [Batrachochytrium salamandrivorans]